MKITNITLFTSVPSLQALANESLDIEATFTVAESLKKIQDALTTFNKLRSDIISKGAKKDDSGNPIHPDGDTSRVELTDEAVADLETLSKLEVDIQIDQLPLSMFKGAKLKPADMTNLLWLIKK